MFEGLRKKFSDLVGSIVKKEETKAEEEAKQETKAEPAAIPKQVKEETKPSPIVKAAPKIEAMPEQKLHVADKPPVHRQEEKKREVKRPEPAPTALITDKPKLSVTSKIKSVILGRVTIKDADVDELLEKFTFSLVEADVSYDVAERLTNDMRTKLVGSTIESKGITSYINQVVSDSLYDVLNKGASTELAVVAKEKKSKGELPFKILFLGPNGAGKTTTIAKVANMMLQNGLTCVLSASDTFRAAAIEQTAIHGERLGVKVIKGTYGADPASIAFDAISYSKAHKVDVVLIDSAGRQDTNKSLMDEMRKIVRVTQPDMKIFVGESITGNAIIDQVREFNDAIKLDGIILTKLDVDSKGGNTISILATSPVPILYFGMGEKYSEIIKYTPDYIVNSIVPRG